MSVYEDMSLLFTEASESELYSVESVYGGIDMSNNIENSTFDIKQNIEQRKIDLSKCFESAYTYAWHGWYSHEPFWDFYAELSKHILNIARF